MSHQDQTGKLRKIRFQPGSIKISTFHLRIVCCTCHIYQFDMCGKNLPLYSFQFESCDEKQRETLPTDPGFSIIDININITRQFFCELLCSTFFATGMTTVWRGLQENVWFSVFWFVCLHGFAPSYCCYENNSKIDILDISQRRNCLKRGGRIFFFKVTM